jgi:hypothetical protein
MLEDIYKKNARMQINSRSGIVSLSLFYSTTLSPASAFRHHGQYGAADPGLFG